VERPVAQGVELKFAGNDALFGAVDVELDQRGEETAGVDAPDQVVGVDRYVLRRLALAIDDAGDAPERRTARAAPLPALRARSPSAPG